jgi:hypothetical protein
MEHALKKACNMLCAKGQIRTQDLGNQAEYLFAEKDERLLAAGLAASYAQWKAKKRAESAPLSCPTFEIGGCQPVHATEFGQMRYI